MTTNVSMLSVLRTLIAIKPSLTQLVDSCPPSASLTAPLKRAESIVFLHAKPLNAERRPIVMLQFLKFAMERLTLAKLFSVEATRSAPINICARTTSALNNNVLRTATVMLRTAKSAQTTNV